MKRVTRGGVILFGLALAGCGSAGKLKPAPGEHLPGAPYGATATPIEPFLWARCWLSGTGVEGGLVAAVTREISVV